MRILLLISQLVAGGAERVMAELANHWASIGHEITLVTLSSDVEQDFYPLEPSIRRIGLARRRDSVTIAHALRGNAGDVLSIRDAIRSTRPDAVVSFVAQTNLLAILATAGLGVPVAACERSDPHMAWIGAVRNVARPFLYARARVVVVQTESLRAWASALGPTVHVHVIPNPIHVPPPRDEGEPRQHSPRRLLVAMGRLAPQKGFDVLLSAFARISRVHPEWSLTILGEGPSRGELEAAVASLGLRDCVRMPGFMPPWPILQKADLFVMPSRFEGFPNALLEAMACGLAAVSTNCPSGPDEIIRSGIDGILVPSDDAIALATALSRLMSDEAERARLGARALQVATRFAPERVFSLWDAVLSDLGSAR